MTDLELVERVRAGDRAAFGELVERHREAVVRAARAALGSHEEADDVAQDAWLTAFRRLQTFRGEASFRTWLLSIAWRRALTRRRRLVRWLSRSPLSDVDPAVGPDAEDRLLTDELAGAVRRAINRLPARYRHALLLAGSGAYSYGEIASMLGIAEGTVKWRVSEARRRLKARLAREGFADE